MSFSFNDARLRSFRLAIRQEVKASHSSKEAFRLDGRTPCLSLEIDALCELASFQGTPFVG